MASCCLAANTVHGTGGGAPCVRSRWKLAPRLIPCVASTAGLDREDADPRLAGDGHMTSTGVSSEGKAQDGHEAHGRLVPLPARQAPSVDPARQPASAGYGDSDAWPQALVTEDVELRRGDDNWRGPVDRQRVQWCDERPGEDFLLGDVLVPCPAHVLGGQAVALGEVGGRSGPQTGVQCGLIRIWATGVVSVAKIR
jgi:hypothetical protein